MPERPHAFIIQDDEHAFIIQDLTFKCEFVTDEKVIIAVDDIEL